MLKLGKINSGIQLSVSWAVKGRCCIEEKVSSFWKHFSLLGFEGFLRGVLALKQVFFTPDCCCGFCQEEKFGDLKNTCQGMLNPFLVTLMSSGKNMVHFLT
jgi:hypothetical protein